MILRKDRKLLHCLAFSVLKGSDVRSVFQNVVIESILYNSKVVDYDLDVRNSAGCLEKLEFEYKEIHTDMYLLPLSAYRFWVARNRVRHLTFRDVFRSFKVVDLYIDERNTATGF